tara:strand:+ start:564 stop:1304 length:741 start_codon:yes stop_codon:yes gene_type:complete
MPVYKGTTEITSGKLYKATTNIENGYKGTDSFYVNQTTLTINFTDNTGSNATLSSAAQVTLTGVPGAAFSTFNRTVTRVDNSTSTEGPSNAISSVTVNETGDTGNNVTSTITGSGNLSRNIAVSGTFPSQNTTVTLTVAATVNQLTSRSVTRSSGNPLSNLSSNGGSIIFAGSWAGGDTGSISMGGSVDASGSLSTSVSGGNTSGSNWNLTWGSGSGSMTSASFTLSVAESSTYRSGTYSEVRNSF